MSNPRDETREQFERALSESAVVMYDLTLIVSGASGLSTRAIANARALCDAHLRGRSTLSIVDLRTAGSTTGVIAAPTLVRNHPLPVVRIVGDLSRTDTVLRALDLAQHQAPGAA